MISLIKTFLKKSKKISGFSLVEVMVALGVMGFISAGTMQLIKMQTKSQKTINISMERSNILFRIKSNLLTEGGCLGTINQARSGFAVGATSAENCMMNGTSLTSISKINSSGVFIAEIARLGQIFGGAGTQIKIDDIKFISSQALDSTNEGELIDATFCIKLMVQGVQDTTYGNLETIHTFPINVTSVPTGGIGSDGNPNTIDSCNSDQTNYIAGNCEALGGKVGDTYKCEGITIDKRTPSSSTSFNIVEGSAISANGNVGVNDNVVVCGNMSVGDNQFNIKERLGVNTNCDKKTPGVTSGVLTVGNMLDVGELISSENATFDSRVEIGKDGGGTLIVDGQTELITGNLSVTNGKIFTNDLTVKNKAFFRGDIQADKAILEDEVTAGDVTIHKNYINSPKSLNIETEELTVYGRIKAIQKLSNGKDINGLEAYASPNPDYLATESWVRSIVLSQMPDSAKRELIKALVHQAEQSGFDTLKYAVLKSAGRFLPEGETTLTESAECNEANSYLKKLIRVYDNVENSFHYIAVCETYNLPSNTPQNCETVQALHNTFFSTIKCPGDKQVINSSCQIYYAEHQYIFRDLKGYGAIHHKNPNEDACKSSACLLYDAVSKKEIWDQSKIKHCSTDSPTEKCNGSYCIYNGTTKHVISALCCDM